MNPKLLFLIFIIPISTYAQITTDGTLGQAFHLSGPDYQIGADLGQQRGGNLFHSFQDFNLQSFESATFSGPDHIQNVISRVTGGNPSRIDGFFRSTIPNADVYFLNPYGIMFGPNARLDVQGSFHVSTADYLRLEEGGRFEVRNPNNSLLTVAPIEAFGFLTPTPAPITLENSDLSLLPGQAFSLIGGDLNLTGDTAIQFDENNTMAFSASKIVAGQVNLASVASLGEVKLYDLGLDLNATGGSILAEKFLIDTSGLGSGAVFIRGGQFMMRDAVVQANTLANQDGQIIDFNLTDSVSLISSNGSSMAILSQSFGSGNAGHLAITTPNLEIISSHLSTSNFGQGNGGSISIVSQQTKLFDGSIVFCFAIESGACGGFNINASEKLSIIGANKGIYHFAGMPLINYPSQISPLAFNGDGGYLNIEAKQVDISKGIIATGSLGVGDAGHLNLTAEVININDGGLISSNGVNSGQAGNINIQVKDTLSISGRRDGLYMTATGEVFEDAQSNISSIGFNSSAGNISISASTLHLEEEGSISATTLIANETGEITITANNLSLSQGGQINSSNGVLAGREFLLGPGQGGAIRIQAQNITIDEGNHTGIFSDTYSEGTGGDIEIKTQHLTIKNHGAITARSTSIGNAGSLSVEANNIKLTGSGQISTEAENAAGGSINLTTLNVLYLQEGQITTSVGTGKGQGGNILIENPQFVVLNQGKVIAQADEGQGGNIRIVAEQFIASPDSLVSASSRLGLDGDVQIDSPNENVTEGMLTLSSETIDASRMMEKTCEARRVEAYENRSYFKVNPIAGSPTSPYDLQPSPLPKTTTTKQPQQISQETITHQPHSMIATTCKPSPTQAKMPMKEERIIAEQLF